MSVMSGESKVHQYAYVVLLESYREISTRCDESSYVNTAPEPTNMDCVEVFLNESLLLTVNIGHYSDCTRNITRYECKVYIREHSFV